MHPCARPNVPMPQPRNTRAPVHMYPCAPLCLLRGLFSCASPCACPHAPTRLPPTPPCTCLQAAMHAPAHAPERVAPELALALLLDQRDFCRRTLCVAAFCVHLRGGRGGTAVAESLLLDERQHMR
eukprot:365381-Chlamydomonas_euryale.AAC.29